MGIWTALFSTKKLEARPPTLDQLRVQVFRGDCIAIRALDKNRAAFAIRPLADGLVEAIVEHSGDGERVLRWDVIRAFGKPDDELFALARTQAAATMRDVEKVDLDGGVQVFVSNDFYLSALMLHNFASNDHAHGVLFAPLSWHHWCAHVVQRATVAPTVALMELVARSVAEQMQVGDFEALTDDLYWYKPSGEIERLELVGKGADRHATSPELVRAMDDAWCGPVTR